jgi:regulator of protease activity HflC (stomatin/prohibitin superfamily)
VGDFLKTLFDTVVYFWPFCLVHQWEAGIYLVNGVPVRPWKYVRLSKGSSGDGLVCKPGLYLKLPWFTDMHCVGLAWDAVESGRIDLVARDNKTISCAVVAQMRVNDPVLAYTEYGNYDVDRVALLRAAVADTLATAESERFDPDRRGRLLGQSLLAAVQALGKRIGHEVDSVQVTTFVLQPKVLRLLT